MPTSFIACDNAGRIFSYAPLSAVSIKVEQVYSAYDWVWLFLLMDGEYWCQRVACQTYRGWYRSRFSLAIDGTLSRFASRKPPIRLYTHLASNIIFRRDSWSHPDLHVSLENEFRDHAPGTILPSSLTIP